MILTSFLNLSFHASNWVLNLTKLFVTLFFALIRFYTTFLVSFLSLKLRFKWKIKWPTVQYLATSISSHCLPLYCTNIYLRSYQCCIIHVSVYVINYLNFGRHQNSKLTLSDYRCGNQLHKTTEYTHLQLTAGTLRDEHTMQTRSCISVQCVYAYRDKFTKTNKTFQFRVRINTGQCLFLAGRNICTVTQWYSNSGQRSMCAILGA